VCPLTAILENGATAATVHLADGSTSRFVFVYNILFYLCAKIGAFIKKMQNRLAYPLHYVRSAKTAEPIEMLFGMWTRDAQ